MPSDDNVERDKDEKKSRYYLHDADDKCRHKIVALWSGIECAKCKGWFCY